MNSQLKRGVLELCVFALLFNSDCYGYGLVKVISDNISITDGTIYPLLKRLKDDGFVDTYLVESKEGPPRKFYHLTGRGKEKMQIELYSWKEFTSGVNEILKAGGIHE